KASGGAAQQDGLQFAAESDPARQREQFAERRPEGHLVRSRDLDRARDTEQLRPCRALGADRSERCAALEQDRQHVDERLDVVDDRRLPEQPTLNRERRLVARLTAVALDRAKDRRLLATDIRAGALAELDVEAEAAAEDVVAEEVSLAGLRECVLHPMLGER